MPAPFDPASSLLIDDFDSFVRYLESKPNLPLTAVGDLKAADLWAINDWVNYKAPNYVTPRSRQVDYPLIGFLYQLVTASRLFLVRFEKSNILVPDAARIDAYRNLTLDEKYVFLLETAWCYADWSAIDGDGRSGQGANWFQSGIGQLLRNPVGTDVTLFTRGWVSEDDLRMIHVSATVNAYVRAGHWFGWYDTREVAQAKRDKYNLQIDRVTLTEWGQQCLTVLSRERPFRYWNKQALNYAYYTDEGSEELRVDINTFADAFRTLLGEPELLSLYPINANPPTGTYWLRAELPAHKVSRTMAIPASMTLDDLHALIQQAFGFGNDHLYGFYMNPRNPYNGEQYYDPRMTDGWADGYPAYETSLTRLDLHEGQQLLYIFDFGDHWEFKITVVRHLPNDKAQKASVVEKVGKAPRQYGND